MATSFFNKAQITPHKGGNQYGSKWIREEKRLAIYIRDYWCCLYCGTNLKDSPASFRTIDHLIPRILGGSNHQANLATCCFACNRLKADRPLNRWYPEIMDQVKAQVIKPLDMKRAKELLALKKIVQGAA